jgi:glycoside/pentoside/hexuronide:cation symporter, GPH family
LHDRRPVRQRVFCGLGAVFYSPTQDTGRTVYVAIGAVALIFAFGRAFDLITDPLVGRWTDRTRSEAGPRRFPRIAGRRRPFIFWGSVLMTVTGILFWYPPIAETSRANLWYGTGLMSLHWGFYTVAYIPVLALAPEIARSQQARVRLGTWIAVGMILGLVLAYILPGVLVNAWDPARPERFSAVGYQRVGILFAFVSLFAFQFLVWTVKERPVEQMGPVVPGPRAMLQAVGMPVFRLYVVIFGLLYVGALGWQKAVPYWVELGLGMTEEAVSQLSAAYLAGALVTIGLSPWISKRVDLKWLIVASLGFVGVSLPFMYPIAVADISDAAKFNLALLVNLVMGFGQGFLYMLVTPLIGEIIDLSERETGRRHEGLFNALHAMMTKGAQIVGIVWVTQLMHFFGNSPERPTGVFLAGPMAGLFCAIGIIAAFRYPILNPVASAPRNPR